MIINADLVSCVVAMTGYHYLQHADRIGFRSVFYEYIDEADHAEVPNQSGRVPLLVLSL